MEGSQPLLNVALFLESVSFSLSSRTASLPFPLSNRSHYMRELSGANEAHSTEMISSGIIAHAAMPGFE